MYLLDTNACIAILNGSSSRLVARLRAEDAVEVVLSAVVQSELWYGAHHSARPAANRALLARFFEPFVVIDFDAAAAEHAGEIRAILASAGTPIGPNDLLIAATARAHGLTLITRNVREFGRVPDLAVENWEN